ncbi:MarR family winged helix-turn-helix transcriptional regulator [Streptomyces sp. NPDC091217]|uniref:MarR family winged helix-turn-helix transcriptional regulator n=1 Tax=Streptomyces sp. NPDC091217 TaxID=3365975 RepID=UPI003825AFC6
MTDPEEPDWLDDEERWNWFQFAYALIRVPAALETQMQRDAGISHFEYLALSTLSMATDRTLRMSDLAEFTASTLSRLSNAVSRLEKRGWVERAPDPADGRYTLATLTDDGSAKVAECAPSHVAEVRRIVLDPLTKAQQRQMGVIARRMLLAIDPDHASVEDRARRLFSPHVK